MSLTAHAVVILPIESKAKAEKCLAAVGRHRTLQVGALLYRLIPHGNESSFGEDSFEWVGWRP